MSSLDTAQSSVKEGNAAFEKSMLERKDASNNEEPQVRDCRFWMVFVALSNSQSLVSSPLSK
jgi:hypothetical protein